MDGRPSTDRWPAPTGPPALLPPPRRQAAPLVAPPRPDPPPLVFPAPPGTSPGPSPSPRRARRRLLLAVVAVAVVAAGSFVLTSGERAEPELTWTDPRSNPHRLASDGEVVCTSGAGGDLYCLEADGGAERFTADVDGTPSSSPTIVGDRVLIGTDREIRAYSLDGEEVWTNATSVRARDLTPLHLPVVDGTVAAIEEGAGMSEPLVGIDVATGEDRWRVFGTGGSASGDEGRPEVSDFSEVLSDGERFYVTTETMPPYVPGEQAAVGPTMTLVAIDPATGEELWQWEISAGSTSFPAATEVTLLPDASAVAFVVQAGGGAGDVVVLDSTTGELRWDEPLTDPSSSVAYVDGVLVVADGTSTSGYDADGTRLWSGPLPDGGDVGLGGLVTSEGHLYLAGYDLVEIDPADGANRRVLPGVSAAHALVVGDALVVAAMSGVRSVALPTSR